MRFTKMQGIGNDYVYVNCFEESVPDPAGTAIKVSDRHFGIGSDGLILIRPSREADCEMDMYNADGSRGAMCGNGIRCVAKYVYDHNIAKKPEIRIATGSGIKTVRVKAENDKAVSVTVDMGAPVLTAEKIPVLAEDPKADAVALPIEVRGETYQFTGVSMGNPHAVIFCDHIDDLDLNDIGPDFEHHPMFPDRVNTEFVKILDRHTIAMRVWERGSGETLACGTGACASAVASILNGHVDEDAPVTVKLLGGDLKIFWDRNAKENRTVYMTGPAEEVFEGEIRI